MKIITIVLSLLSIIICLCVPVRKPKYKHRQDVNFKITGFYSPCSGEGTITELENPINGKLLFSEFKYEIRPDKVGCPYLVVSEKDIYDKQ